MLEMSTQESLYSGLFALSIQGLKQNYLVISATNAAPQFLKGFTVNLPTDQLADV